MDDRRDWPLRGTPDPRVLARARATVIREGFPVTRLPHVGDDVTAGVDLVSAYAELVAVSMARAKLYGELLAQQYTDQGLDGLIGGVMSTEVVSMGGGVSEVELVQTGEAMRALVDLESQERDRAAKLIQNALKIGVSISQTEALRTYGRSMARAIEQVVHELGLDIGDSSVLRVAQRAALLARRALGQDDGDPDVLIGPALTVEERQRILVPVLAG